MALIGQINGGNMLWRLRRRDRSPFPAWFPFQSALDQRGQNRGGEAVRRMTRTRERVAFKSQITARHRLGSKLKILRYGREEVREKRREPSGKNTGRISSNPPYQSNNQRAIFRLTANVISPAPFRRSESNLPSGEKKASG